MEIHPEIRLRLSLQTALLGEITPNIRGITNGQRLLRPKRTEPALTCACNENVIVVRCYFAGEITEEDEDSIDCVEGEVIADFAEYAVDLQCIKVDMSESLAQYRLSTWVYLRKE